MMMEIYIYIMATKHSKCDAEKQILLKEPHVANGCCTEQHRQALSFTARRDEGKAMLSFRHNHAADSPSGVSLQRGRN